MKTVWHDIRYGLRMMARSPGFTAVAVLSMALGIGANTSIFSAVNTVLLRPLPYPEPGQLVQILKSTPPGNQIAIGGGEFVGAHEFLAWEERSRLCSHLAAYQSSESTLTGLGAAERLPALRVSSEFFTLLGVQPMLGRAFIPDDDRPGGPPVVLVSYGFWKRFFGGDPSLIGQPLMINDAPLTVIGILPASFQFGELADLYMPIRLERAKETPGAGRIMVTMLKALARLKPGVEIEQAGVELDGIAMQVNTALMNTARQQSPDSSQSAGEPLSDRDIVVGGGLKPPPMPSGGGGMMQMMSKGPRRDGPDPFDLTSSRIEVVGLHEHMVANARVSLLVLFGAVGLVLLIACANTANLLLCRSEQRRKEIAVRSSLGANRLRIVRLLLTESLLLSISGGVLGFVASFWGVKFLSDFRAGHLPHIYDIGIDWRVLVFTLSISICCGVLFGLVPALQATSRDMNQSLKEGARHIGRGSRHHRLRNGLQVGEVAMALTLLVGSGLLLKSFYLLLNVNTGFVPEQLLTAQTLLNKSRYTQRQQMYQFSEDLLGQLQAIPGVRSASVSSKLPLMKGFAIMMAGLRIEGRPQQGDFGRSPVSIISVSTDYFRTLGVPLLKGTVFSELDRADSPSVAVVNEAFVHRYFPDEDPIGKRIVMPVAASGGVEVVGVVGNIRQTGYDRDVVAEIYRPFAQAPEPSLNICVRTQGHSTTIASNLRAIVTGIDDKQPVYNIMTMEQRLSDSVAPRRLSTLLLGTFASLALILSAVGIFGVMSYSVNERTFEIGMRMALGASSQNVLTLILNGGLKLTFLGISIGLLGAFSITRVIRGLLYDVNPTDPFTYASVSFLLLGVALLACYIPARRAARIDPMEALRYE